MNTVKSIEQHLIFEIASRFNSFSSRSWAQRKQNFLKSLDRFMLDLDVKEFKELELPSEAKPKSKTEEKLKPKSRRKRRHVGKQLQLFFLRPTKKILLSAVETIENMLEGLHRNQEQENTLRN